TAALVPLLGRLVPAAGEAQRVRPLVVDGRSVVEPREPPPEAEARNRIRIAEPVREHPWGGCVDVVLRAFEPGNLGPGRREILMSKLLLARDADGGCGGECVSRSRITASRAYEREHAEGFVVRPGRLPRVVDDGAGVADGVVPAATVERPAGRNRLDVDPPEVLGVLGAVLYRTLDVPLDQVVPVAAQRAIDERVEPARRDLVLAHPSGGVDRLREHVDALFGAASRDRARDGDPGVSGDRRVAETLADLLRTARALE